MSQRDEAGNLASGTELLIAMLGPVVWFSLLVSTGALLGDPLRFLHDHLARKDEFVAKWPFAMLIAGAVGVGVFLDVLRTRKPGPRSRQRSTSG